MTSLRIIFMGTPDFSVPTLERLHESRHSVVGVVTKPDAPKGRGRKLEASAVKEAAERLSLPCRQPASLRDEETLDHLRSLAPDLVVVVAFRILPPEVLAVPTLGAINFHASLLPKYRGPAPIQWAIINGETRTGVTVFLLEPTVDTGKIIRQRDIAIGPDETYGDLYGRLSHIGAAEVVAAAAELADGTARLRPQDDREATRAPKLARGDGMIVWAEPAARIRNRVRGVTPEPGAFTVWRDAPLGVLRVDYAENAPTGEPGRIVIAHPKRGVAVATADGAVWLTTVQPAGKRPMNGAAWVRGARPEVGRRFGSYVGEQR